MTIAPDERLDRAIKRLNTRITWLTKRADRASGIRLAVFFTGVLLTFGAYFVAQVPGFVLMGVVWLITFLVAARAHRRILNGLHNLRTWRAIRLDHRARISLQWEALPPAYLPSDPTETAQMLITDLDLAGAESVHRLIDTAITSPGSGRLLDWLTVGKLTPGIADRQRAVEALAARGQFRRKLTLHGRNAAGIPDYQKPTAARWNPGHVLTWISHEHPADGLPLPVIVAGLGLLAVLNATLFALNVTPLVVYTFILFFILNFTVTSRIGEPFTEALSIRDALDGLGNVFGFLERRPPPVEAGVNLPRGSNRFSLALRRLSRIGFFAGLRGNPLLAFVLNAVMPYDPLLALLLRRERQHIKADLPIWLEAWSELEALCSLATWRDLHPDTCRPNFTTAQVVEAEEVCHPLIGAGAVANSVAIDNRQMILITGSNMAGKSTFLRTLGVSMCLAYAGGHVLADSFMLGSWRLFTCIRVSDSVTDGFSYFYAEVRRLKALLDALNESPNGSDVPLFYLIDEIFRGTNNQERYIGSHAYITALASGNGAGALSTHDLELVKTADDRPNIRNMHFREDVADGLMTFDYTLRDGPSPTTNAVRIMRMAGLPV